MGEPTWTREKLRRLVDREIGDYRLIVVSNRQPYVHELIDGELRYASPAGKAKNCCTITSSMPIKWSFLDWATSPRWKTPRPSWARSCLFLTVKGNSG